MASTGDNAGSGGSKAQAGAKEFMEKVDNTRIMLSQAKSESNPDRVNDLMKQISKQTKIAMELVFAHDLPDANISLLKDLCTEVKDFCAEGLTEIEKEISNKLFAKKHEDKNDK